MRRSHRLFAVLLAVLLLAFAVPTGASANGPAPRPYFEFATKNLPEGTAFVDLLIYLPETDPMYREGEPWKLPAVFEGNTQIIDYCEQDYRSYTFHYYDALSRIQVNREGHVFFFTDGSSYYDGETVRDSHEVDVKQRGMIRLAMLDGKGNILKVSKPLSLEPKGLFAYSAGFFIYDGATDELEVDSHSNVLAVFLFLLAGLLGIWLTCALEGLVAGPFGLRQRYGRMILWTNLVSQVLMRAAQGLSAYLPLGRDSSLPYVCLVAALEVIVYLCEFLFYRRRMRDITWKRCLLYTVTANTVSLLGGLGLLVVIFFM